MTGKGNQRQWEKCIRMQAVPSLQIGRQKVLWSVFLVNSTKPALVKGPKHSFWLHDVQLPRTFDRAPLSTLRGPFKSEHCLIESCISDFMNFLGNATS